MIHTAKQLKDKVKNMSGGNSEVAQALIRTYFMERFLERVSVSEYSVIRQIKRCHFRQIKTGLLECLIMV